LLSAVKASRVKSSLQLILFLKLCEANFLRNGFPSYRPWNTFSQMQNVDPSLKHFSPR